VNPKKVEFLRGVRQAAYKVMPRDESDEVTRAALASIPSDPAAFHANFCKLKYGGDTCTCGAALPDPLIVSPFVSGSQSDGEVKHG
jgi:hypothetical protein